MLFSSTYSRLTSYWMSTSSSFSSFSIQSSLSYFFTNSQIEKITSVASRIFLNIKHTLSFLGDRGLKINSKVVVIISSLSLLTILALTIFRHSTFLPLAPFKCFYQRRTSDEDQNSFHTFDSKNSSSY